MVKTMESPTYDKYGNVLTVGDVVIGILTHKTDRVDTAGTKKYKRGRTVLSKGIVEKLSQTQDKLKVYIKWHEINETTRIFSDRVYKLEEDISAKEVYKENEE
jgi:hypothetical protein